MIYYDPLKGVKFSGLLFIFLLVVFIILTSLFLSEVEIKRAGYKHPIIVELDNGKVIETSRMLISEWQLECGITIDLGNGKINHKGSYTIKEKL